MRLNGKIAAVTGAGSGFGEGIVRRFVEEGAKVIVADINDSAGGAVAGSLDVLQVLAQVIDRLDVAAPLEKGQEPFWQTGVSCLAQSSFNAPDPFFTFSNRSFIPSAFP